MTVTLQFEEAARLAPQVLLETEKSPALVPEIAMLLMAIADVPRLVKVTACGVPDDPRATLSHTRLLGSMRTPATRQPDREREIRKRIAPGENMLVRFQRIMLRRFDLRVKVPSSSFILLGGKRTKDEDSESAKQQTEASKEHFPRVPDSPISVPHEVVPQEAWSRLQLNGWMQELGLQLAVTANPNRAGEIECFD